jgi:hypothetical protein
MSTPGEHNTVKARILAYAEAIGWTIVSREEAEQRRGFGPDVPPANRAKNRSLFFDDLLDAKVRGFNPRHTEPGALRPGSVAVSSPTSTTTWSSSGTCVAAAGSWTTAQTFVRGCQNPHLMHFGLQAMNNTLIEAELPAELAAQARAFVAEGWATDFNDLLAEALRRFLESHEASVTESFIKDDIEWGLHGRD